MVTDKQKRIKIAELLGAKLIDNPTNSGPDKLWSFGAISPGDVFAKMWICGEEDALLPDYLNDFNAMHEAEKIMTEEQRWKQACLIVGYHVGPAGFPLFSRSEVIKLISATLPQRLEAFGKTMKLW